jgi:hypothetical protein
MCNKKLCVFYKSTSNITIIKSRRLLSTEHIGRVRKQGIHVELLEGNFLYPVRRSRRICEHTIKMNCREKSC